MHQESTNGYAQLFSFFTIFHLSEIFISCTSYSREPYWILTKGEIPEFKSNFDNAWFTLLKIKYLKLWYKYRWTRHKTEWQAIAEIFSLAVHSTSWEQSALLSTTLSSVLTTIGFTQWWFSSSRSGSQGRGRFLSAKNESSKSRSVKRSSGKKNSRNGSKQNFNNGVCRIWSSKLNLRTNLPTPRESTRSYQT